MGSKRAPIEIRAAAGADDVGRVRRLWREYWNALGLPDDFQDFADELAGLPGAYAPPRGALLLAFVEGAAAGTIALRGLNRAAGELKRLYVDPRYRGRGVAGALLDRMLERASQLGYQAVYGDTLPSMQDALAMYQRRGFHQVDAYHAQPTPGAIYLKLDLPPRHPEPTA